MNGTRTHPTSRRLIGVGSAHGVDAIGWELVRAVRAHLPHSLPVDELAEPSELLHLPPADSWWIVDAALSSLPTPRRSLQIVPWKEQAPLPSQSTSASCHGWSLIEYVSLAASLGRLPAEVIFLLAPIPDDWQDDNIRRLAGFQVDWERQLLSFVTAQLSRSRREDLGGAVTNT